EKCSIPGMMNSEREEEVLPEPKEREPKVEEAPQAKISNKVKGNREQKHSHFESKGKAVEEKLVLEDILIEEEDDTSSTIQVIDTKNSDAKYKWSGKWPRQLGKKKD
ncbi:MAG: hypothetical protein H6Q69_4244, partial [Firmicutes bacterium]|nr:hypothetical protein [Bacillota bacterium]